VLTLELPAHGVAALHAGGDGRHALSVGLVARLGTTGRE
jgi:hypothetical protein